MHVLHVPFAGFMHMQLCWPWYYRLHMLLWWPSDFAVYIHGIPFHRLAGNVFFSDLPISVGSASIATFLLYI